MPYFTHGETKNKLILLYAADHAAALPTREQLYRTAILNSEMEYFAFEEALGELLEDGLLTEVPKPFGAGLGLTDLGREALSLFEKSIPQNERDRLDAYLSAHRTDFLRETQISSRIEKTASGPMLHLTLSEADRTVLSVSLAAASEEQALSLRSRWDDAAEDVYNFIWDTLTEDRHES
jgi:hypothetical protein